VPIRYNRHCMAGRYIVAHVLISGGFVWELEKCIGRKVDLIYIDTSGRFSQRRVNLFAVRNGKARVYDVKKRGFRTLSDERILAFEATL
jgi:hypothetical protein